eukprot:1161919-Pelagomonas_calceolata.AAC.3
MSRLSCSRAPKCRQQYTIRQMFKHLSDPTTLNPWSGIYLMLFHQTSDCKKQFCSSPSYELSLFWRVLVVGLSVSTQLPLQADAATSPYPRKASIYTNKKKSMKQLN